MPAPMIQVARSDVVSPKNADGLEE